MVSRNISGFLKAADDAKIAYRKVNALASHETLPEIVFCGGFASDMKGTKAEALADYCEEQGFGFVRFDYRGHGESDGLLADYGIGDWIEDARLIVKELTNDKFILIGSSMGGWIASYIANQLPQRVAYLIGIAAAPDFTEDMFWAGFSEDERAASMAGKTIERPSGYDEPYKITPHLIAQGREHLVLRDVLNFPMPVRLFQGLDDASVSSETALKLANHANCENLTVEFVKNADHSFSRPQDLEMLKNSLHKAVYFQNGDAPS